MNDIIPDTRDMRDKNPHILIVDDTPENIKVIGTILREKHFKITFAQSGSRALDMVKQNPPDLILLDIKMPGMDGFEVCRRLKADEITRDISIIFLTVATTTEEKIQGLKLGAVDYITKPFQPAEVVARVKTHLTIRNLQQRLEAQNAQLQQEITERKQAEEALRASEGKWRSLVEHAPARITTLDRNGTILFINRTMASGHTPELIIGTNVYAYLPSQEQEKTCQVLETVFRSGETAYYESAIIIDGTTVWYDNRIAPIKADNQIIAALFISTDITERKQAEEHLKAILHEKEVLLKEVHHRVKNNLQMVSSLLYLQSHTVKDTQTLEVLNESMNRVKSMSLVHEQLYRSENLADIDFAQFIRSFSAHLFHTYKTVASVVSLEVNVEDVFLTIDMAIPCALILNELITNAFKHAFPEGCSGEIRIAMSEQPDHLTLRVSDTGVGIQEDLDIQRVDSLGLDLVTDLVTRQLNGTIELDRTGGTTFMITFPKTTTNTTTN